MNNNKIFKIINQDGIALVMMLLISFVLALLAVNLMNIVFMQFKMTAASISHDQSMRVGDNALHKLLQKIQTEVKPETSSTIITEQHLTQEHVWRAQGRIMTSLNMQVAYIIERLQVEPCLQGKTSSFPGVTFYRITLRVPASGDATSVIYLQSSYAKATPLPSHCHLHAKAIRLINLGPQTWRVM